MVFLTIPQSKVFTKTITLSVIVTARTKDNSCKLVNSNDCTPTHNAAWKHYSAADIQ